MRTAARARALGVGRWTTDVGTLIGDRSIDVVHVCTPNQTHADHASRALEAGKHVVIEKPVATDPATGRRLAALARDRGVHAAVALTYRGYPMVRGARARIDRGDVGRIRLVHGAYIQDWLADESDYNWRLEPEVGGASRAVADIGTHWFDTVEFMTGTRIEAVFADLATFLPRRRRPVRASAAFDRGDGPTEEVEVHSEDAATILVRFEGGARGACVISQVSPGRKNGLAIEIAGSAATIIWNQEDAERLHLLTRDEERTFVRGPGDGAAAGEPGLAALPAGHPEGWAEALRDLFRPFYAAIASGEPPTPEGNAYPTIDDGVRGLDLVGAVLASAASGRWVDVADHAGATDRATQEG
jgi:predicted dehydrogenase